MGDPIVASLEWKGSETFAAEVADHAFTVDGEASAGASPMQHLALAIAGCMGIDVAHILGRMRQEPDEMRIEVEATRADDPPRRFTRVRLAFELVGDVKETGVERALELSREKYCSAWATVRPEVRLETSYRISPPRSA